MDELIYMKRHDYLLISYTYFLTAHSTCTVVIDSTLCHEVNTSKDYRPIILKVLYINCVKLDGF